MKQARCKDNWQWEGLWRARELKPIWRAQTPLISSWWFPSGNVKIRKLRKIHTTSLKQENWQNMSVGRIQHTAIILSCLIWTNPERADSIALMGDWFSVPPRAFFLSFGSWMGPLQSCASGFLRRGMYRLLSPKTSPGLQNLLYQPSCKFPGLLRLRSIGKYYLLYPCGCLQHELFVKAASA